MAIQHSITTPTIHHVPFHEDQLSVLRDERTGKEYVLPKPMAELFGLDWSGQLKKLNRNQLFKKGMVKMSIPSAGGEQEAVLLERRLVHAWLFSLDINRVTLERQKKLLRYQEECADVLDAYFTKGYAANPRGNSSVTAPWDMLAQLVEEGRQGAIAVAELQESRRESDARQLAQQQDIIALQAQQLEGLRGVASANVKADMAIANQQWLTVRKYVFLHDLERQMPPSVCKAYGTFLTGYCLENGIPVDDQPVADRQWSKENSYHAEVIVKTLPGWLNRQHSQPTLTILPAGGTA